MPIDRKRADVTVELGRRVRALRQERNLSQEKLAEKARVHRTYVGSLERGERNVALINIVRLAEALGVDPCELVKGMTSD
jgi:transcriptional regulator with XRE-family HTH domain